MPPQASPQPQRPPAYGGRKSTSVQPSSAVLIILLPGISPRILPLDMQQAGSIEAQKSSVIRASFL
jgi:hypothetical protein